VIKPKLAIGLFCFVLTGLVAPGVSAQVDDGNTTSTTVAEAPEVVDNAQATIQKVMYGLIVVGVLLLALAVFYWWKTRPQPPRSENVYRRDD